MRKLATASLAFSAAIFLANYCIPSEWLLYAAVLAAVIGAGTGLLRRKWLRPAVVVLLFFALGLTEYALYYRATIARAGELAGQTREICAAVIDYPEEYESYCRIRVRITDKDLPHFKAIVYDSGKSFAHICPGQHIRFEAAVSTADTLYGKPYDNEIVNGFYLRLRMKGEGEITGESFSPGALPVRVRHALCRRVDTIFPGDVSAFLKALMLGDKEALYRDDALYVSMSRAGLMHIAAVSGLHVAFLVGMILFAFGKGRRGAIIGIGLVWCFVLVTGCSKSALRAAVMQTLLLMAPLLRRENDPITSLSAALALLLVFCPFSAKSVSLQLSFGAMAGLVCFGERILHALTGRLGRKTRRGPLGYAAGVLASSLSVMVFTVPLTALHFSYVQLLSMLSNLACLWAVSVCFCLVWCACALSSVPMLGACTAWICTGLVQYIRFCAGLVSRLPFSVLYMQTEGAGLWIAASYLLFIGSVLLLRRKRVLRILLPCALSLAMLAGVLFRAVFFYRENSIFTVLDVGQGQCICAMAGENTAVVDCGNTSSLENAGALAGEYLLSCGRRSIQVLMLTHLHADHANGAVRLMEMLPVETLILPADADDGGLRAEILACAERHGTEVHELDVPAQITAGGICMQIYKLPGDRNENERCLMATLSIGDTDMLITADAPKRLERTLAAQEDLRGTDILIAGHHGSKSAGADELLAEAGGGLAVISTGYNTYGHPAPETVERLESYGYRVFRTDRDGSVEIRAGGKHG